MHNDPDIEDLRKRIDDKIDEISCLDNIDKKYQLRIKRTILGRHFDELIFNSTLIQKAHSEGIDATNKMTLCNGVILIVDKPRDDMDFDDYFVIEEYDPDFEGLFYFSAIPRKGHEDLLEETLKGLSAEADEEFDHTWIIRRNGVGFSGLWQEIWVKLQKKCYYSLTQKRLPKSVFLWKKNSKSLARHLNGDVSGNLTMIGKDWEKVQGQLEESLRQKLIDRM